MSAGSSRVAGACAVFLAFAREVFIWPNVASKDLHLLTTRQLGTEHLSPREEDVLRLLVRQH
ncbi:hypothetical protein [Deinococcus metallilatus]|uniref:DNA-binding NarL/FixJ family response regulator n=1 Tax=Deinococcus metallilatus TaxID=1211322 RepID=A0ABR6MMT3_9DEIO|nr:hypothetical protein [Deinococcus metallilatus]MBB5293255.1 DNA-binding NarL/FixJ family response regulator [Deinococcus metallilatus]GMA15522.1 hypothetical protein GCM10025871_18530 [Deinococcus metallilatus]